ncbi:hypothetical protein AWENTII_006653 [Aspergillus wentii]
MAAKPRLTLASMWAFEDIGVQEIQDKFKKSDDQPDFLCEYSKTDDVLVIKGNPEGSTSKYASLVSDFIEEQKNKDLLDMPRISQLEIPVIFDDEMSHIPVGVEKDQEGDLLALDDGSNEEFIPLSINHDTKYWLSSSGGLGCFSANFHEVLAEVATMTGTEISIIDDIKGIQVSGKNQGDVDDALAKLTRIEKPLSFINNPRVGNMIVAPEDEGARFRIQNYSNLNSVALSRILSDPNLSSNANLCQVFVTLLLEFDTETQSFHEPPTLLNPPSISNEAGKSRIWNDFIFQEIGKGEDFLTMESIVEKDPANPQVLASGIAPLHPYLTAEKAKRVNQWVVDRAEMEGEAESEPSLPSDPKTAREQSELAPVIKRPRGIRTRKVAQTAKDQALPSTKTPAIQPESAKDPDPNLSENAATNRKRLIIPYEPDSGDILNAPQEIPSHAVSNTGMGSTADAFRDSSAVAKPQITAKRNRLPTIFDETKYDLKWGSKYAETNGRTIPNISNSSNIGEQPKSQRGPGRKNELIDVFESEISSNKNSHPLISFNQPALIPEKPPSNSSKYAGSCSQKQSVHKSEPSFDLLEPKIGNGMGFSSDRPLSILDTKSSSEADLLDAENDERLMALKRTLDKQKQEVTFANLIHNSRSHSDVKRELYAGRLWELENPYKPEEQQSIDESATRQFYQTMIHKMAKPSQKAKSKAEIKAKRQATLEDAWGIPKKTSTKQPIGHQELPNGQSKEDGFKSGKEASAATKQPSKNPQQVKAEMHMNGLIKSLFEALKPTLDAAEHFPGGLTLEVQMGLILIPLLPKTYSGGLLSLNEWTKIFQPRNGLPAPTTKFINRLTTSGTDVDHIVDLKTSKAEGKRRLFEQDYTEYSVFYEYHCRTNADQLFVITIDEQGRHSIKKPTTALGAVNLHFPGQTWDASFVVNGITDHVVGSDQELEDAVQHLVDSLWVQPDKSHIRIFTRTPKGNKFVIEKVFLKRWTRHRYIRAGDTTPKVAADTVVSVTSNRDLATAADDARSEANTGDQNSTTHDSEITENQDIFLQIMEVQDLFVGSSLSDTQAVRARCASLPEMQKKGRQWYEASLISPSIEAMLKSNANVEVGERTDDWRSADLLGDDAAILSDGEDSSPPSPSPLSAVATAIGATGLGHLLRLAKTVVEKIDGIGFRNCGPGEAARMAAAATAGPVPMTGTLPGNPAMSGTGNLVRVEQKCLEFEDLESIKDVGSAIVNTPMVKTPSGSSAEVEQGDLDFW